MRTRTISLIEGKSEQHPISLFASLMTPLFIVTILAAIAVENPRDWDQDRQMPSSIVNLERLRGGAPTQTDSGF